MTCPNTDHTRTRICDTCAELACLECSVVTSLGGGSNPSSAYTECPLCVAERAEYEEYGPKSVSIKSIIPPAGARLAPSLGAMSTVWADGPSYRVRPWRKGGAA